MSSIPMADNVISYKKSKETLKNQNRWFRYKDSAPDLRNHHKLQQKKQSHELLEGVTCSKMGLQ